MAEDVLKKWKSEILKKHKLTVKLQFYWTVQYKMLVLTVIFSLVNLILGKNCCSCNCWTLKKNNTHCSLLLSLDYLCIWLHTCARLHTHTHIQTPFPPNFHQTVQFSLVLTLPVLMKKSSLPKSHVQHCVPLWPLNCFCFLDRWSY